MEPLHAPWRIQYILGPKPAPTDESIFSRIAREQNDEKNHVIARGKTCFAILNNYLAEIKQFVPDKRIYTDELRTLGWGTDASFYRQIPKIVVRSDGEEEMSLIIRLCSKY